MASSLHREKVKGRHEKVKVYWVTTLDVVFTMTAQV